MPRTKTADRQCITDHADRLCDALDLSSPDDVEVLRLRVVSLDEFLEARLHAIEDLESQHTHIDNWIGTWPLRRQLTLEVSAMALAWDRVFGASGEFEPAPELARSLARAREQAIEARIAIDRDIDAFLDEARAELEAGRATPHQ